MSHPLAPNLSGLKDDELHSKFGELMKRYNQAYRFGPVGIIQQLQMLMGDYQAEIDRRNAKLMEEMAVKAEKARGGKGLKGIIDIK